MSIVNIPIKYEMGAATYMKIQLKRHGYCKQVGIRTSNVVNGAFLPCDIIELIT